MLKVEIQNCGFMELIRMVGVDLQFQMDSGLKQQNFRQVQSYCRLFSRPSVRISKPLKITFFQDFLSNYKFIFLCAAAGNLIDNAIHLLFHVILVQLIITKNTSAILSNFGESYGFILLNKTNFGIIYFFVKTKILKGINL